MIFGKNQETKDATKVFAMAVILQIPTPRLGRMLHPRLWNKSTYSPLHRLGNQEKMPRESDWNQQRSKKRYRARATQNQIIQYELIQLKARESHMFFSR